MSCEKRFEASHDYKQNTDLIDFHLTRYFERDEPDEGPRRLLSNPALVSLKLSARRVLPLNVRWEILDKLDQ